MKYHLTTPCLGSGNNVCTRTQSNYLNQLLFDYIVQNDVKYNIFMDESSKLSDLNQT